MKAVALGGLAVLSVVTFNYGLKVATDGLLLSDNEKSRALAEAPQETPRKILAPATATPSLTEKAEIAGSWGDDSFGAADPEFGQANPALGEPAWGAAERARQAAAAAADNSPETGS